MESEDLQKDNSNSRQGQSEELDYEQMMNLILDQNKQLGGPLIPQPEYRGESSSQEAGVGSIRSNLGKELGANEFGSNMNEFQLYQTGHEEGGGLRSSAHLSQTSFRSVASGVESTIEVRDQPYADQSDQTSVVRERSRSGGRSSDPQVAHHAEVESDRAIQFLHGHARDESNFLFSKQSQISSRQLVSKMSQDFNELLAAGSPDQLVKAAGEEHLLQPTEERNDEDQSEQYQSLKRHIFGSRPALKNPQGRKSSREEQNQFDLRHDQVNQFELKNDKEYQEEPGVGSFHSSEQQSASRGHGSDLPQLTNEYVDKDQPLIQTLAKIQEVMQHHEYREQEQPSLTISNNYISAGAGKGGAIQAEYDQICLELSVLKQQLLLSRQIIEKDKQMKMKLVLKLKEQQKEIAELSEQRGTHPETAEVGTQVSDVDEEGGAPVKKEYCDKYAQTLPQLLVSEKLELDSHQAQRPGRATVRQSLVSFLHQPELVSRNHAAGFRSKRYSLMKARNAPRLFNFESDLTGLRNSCLSARQNKYEFASFFEMKKGQISNKLERLRTMKNQKLNAQPQVPPGRRSHLQHRAGSVLLYEEFRTQKTAKQLPESRLSLLNRDWKSQISEENSVASSPLKAREIPGKRQGSQQNAAELNLSGMGLQNSGRPKSYHVGDFDKQEALVNVEKLRRRNTYTEGLSRGVAGASGGADGRDGTRSRGRSARSAPETEGVEGRQAEDATEELKTSYDSEPCPFQQSEDPQAGIDEEGQPLRVAEAGKDAPSEKVETKRRQELEVQAQEGNCQVKVEESQDDDGEAKVEAGDAGDNVHKQGDVPGQYPGAGAEERQVPPVPPLRALLPGSHHRELQQPIFVLGEPGSPNAGFLNVNIKKHAPPQTHHTAPFSKTQNLRGQLCQTMSLSDLARHKHFASVTAESNQYFWKAKFEELLREKKKQMKQIHDLNQNIQTSESQLVALKNQMKTSLEEKEVTIEELMKEIVHCRVQIQQLKRSSIVIPSELMRSSAGSELSHAKGAPATSAQAQPRPVPAAPGSLEAAIKTITESLSTKILRTQQEQHQSKPAKESVLLLQAKRNSKFSAAYAQSKASPPRAKKAIKTQPQIRKEVQLAQRDAPSRQGRPSTGSTAKKTKKFTKKQDEKEARPSSRAKATSKPVPKRASDLSDGSAGFRRLPTPIVDSMDQAEPVGEGGEERSRSSISLDHIDVANIDESLLRVSGGLGKGSPRVADKTKDAADSFAIADDIDEQQEHEEKQRVIVATKYNRNPSLSRGGQSCPEASNAQAATIQDDQSSQEVQLEPEAPLFSQQQRPVRNLLFHQPIPNPLESLLSINFKNDAVLASRLDARASQPKAPVMRTRDSLDPGYPLTYTAQYLKSEQFKKTQKVGAAPQQKTAGRPSLPQQAQPGRQPGLAKSKPILAKQPKELAEEEPASTARSRSGKLKLKVKKAPLDRYGPYLVGAQANNKRKPVKASRSRNPTFAGVGASAAGTAAQLPGNTVGAAALDASQRSVFLSSAPEDFTVSLRSPHLTAREIMPSMEENVANSAVSQAEAASQLQSQYFRHLREVEDRKAMRDQIRSLADASPADSMPGEGLQDDQLDGLAGTERVDLDPGVPEISINNGLAQLPVQIQLQSARDRGQGEAQEQLSSMLQVQHQASVGTQPAIRRAPQPKTATSSPLKPASSKVTKKECKSTVPTQPVLQRGAWAASRASLSAKSTTSLKPTKPTKVKAYASSRSNAGGSILASSGNGKIGRIVAKKSTLLSQSMLAPSSQSRKAYSKTSRSIETKFAKFLKGQAPPVDPGQHASPSALLGAAQLSITDIK